MPTSSLPSRPQSEDRPRLRAIALPRDACRTELEGTAEPSKIIGLHRFDRIERSVCPLISDGESYLTLSLYWRSSGLPFDSKKKERKKKKAPAAESGLRNPARNALQVLDHRLLSNHWLLANLCYRNNSIALDCWCSLSCHSWLCLLWLAVIDPDTDSWTYKVRMFA